MRKIAQIVGLEITSYVDWTRAERSLFRSLRALIKWGRPHRKKFLWRLFCRNLIVRANRGFCVYLPSFYLNDHLSEDLKSGGFPLGRGSKLSLRKQAKSSIFGFFFFAETFNLHVCRTYFSMCFISR